MINIGDRIRTMRMGGDSYYLQAEGIVTDIKNDLIFFRADYVMDRYSKKWKKHPTSCATAARIENIVKLFMPEQSVKFQLTTNGE